MHEILRAGIPTPEEYHQLLSHTTFRTLENYSKGFLAKHHHLLQPYAKRWVIDPLHQWSRQWEYPFMFAALSALVDVGHPVRILDAGSGMTFFPYFLLEQFPALDIDCCDIDASLQALHAKIATAQARKPQFTTADMTALPYPDASFDAIYCVSVLEHIPGRERVMKEFARVLKPRGSLVISFDLCPDGSRDISMPDARRMMTELEHYFQDTAQLEIPAGNFPDARKIFSTYTARAINPQLLPWTYPAVLYQTRAFLQGKGWPAWPPLLTASCGVLQKKA